MATLAASTSHHHPFSTSTSSNSELVHPTTRYSYGSDNPLTQLPRVDFNFEDLRQRMAAFTAKFDVFVEKGRKRVLEERNEFRGRMGEIAEDTKATTLRISCLTSTLNSHASLVAREASEKHDLNQSIASLESQHAAHAAACSRLRSAMASTQRQIDQKLEAQRTYSAKVEEQARMNGPELTFWENYLGVRVEGSGDGRTDVVRVVFGFEGSASKKKKGEDAGDKERDREEGSFELKIPERGGYTVVDSTPKLDEKEVGRLLDKLNQDRDLGPFLKGMRGMFQDALK